MNTYTQVILTVIAIALTAIAIQNSGILPARAAQGAMTVQICGQGVGSLLTGPPKDRDCVKVFNGALATTN